MTTHKKPRNDITGNTYGYLLVTGMERLTVGNKTQFMAICKCLKCDKENVVVRPDAIKSGHKKSCGCMAKYAYKNIIGENFGYLTVLDEFREYVKSIKKHKYYCTCHCSNCGNSNFKVIKASIINKRTTSCGCSKDRYIKTSGKNNKKFIGYEDITGTFWSKMQRSASIRSLEFNITKKYAWDLYLSQNKKCKLSGLDITIKKQLKTKRTASLDRIDSSKGYIEGNVQWVHKFINISKNSLDNNSYINLCHLVANNNPINNKILDICLETK